MCVNDILCWAHLPHYDYKWNAENCYSLNSGNNTPPSILSSPIPGSKHPPLLKTRGSFLGGKKGLDVKLINFCQSSVEVRNEWCCKLILLPLYALMAFKRNLFLSYSDLSLYLLVIDVGVEVIVTPDHTQSHRHAVELLWIRDRTIAETST